VSPMGDTLCVFEQFAPGLLAEHRLVLKLHPPSLKLITRGFFFPSYCAACECRQESGTDYFQHMIEITTIS
jgi:hypothetical protein